MVDTRTWDDTTYAAYMRGRRGEPEPPATPDPLAAAAAFPSIVATKLQQTNGNMLPAIHAALTQVGIDAAAILGFSLMPGGDYRSNVEHKFNVTGQQVTIPAGTDIAQS